MAWITAIQLRDLRPFLVGMAGITRLREESASKTGAGYLMKNKYFMVLIAILGALLAGGIFYLGAIQLGLKSLLASGQADDRTWAILGLLAVGPGLGLFGLYSFQQAKQLGRQPHDMEEANTLLKEKVNELTVELTNTVKQLNQETGQRRLLAVQLKEQTTTDPLTGLLNRGAGMALLVNQLHLSERHQWPLTVWSISIDNLKQVKDKFGYEAGDQMIKEISRIVRANIRESDTVFRMGEYELIVILLPCSIVEASGIRDRMINSFRLDRHINPYDWQSAICDGFAEHQPGCRMRVTDLVQQAGHNAYAKVTDTLP